MNALHAARPDVDVSSGWRIAQLREETGMETGALNGYAEKAGIPKERRPGRGRRDHRYTDAEHRKILEAIVANSSSNVDRRRAVEAIKALN